MDNDFGHKTRAEELLEEMLVTKREKFKQQIETRLNEIAADIKKGKWDPREAVECVIMDMVIKKVG